MIVNHTCTDLFLYDYTGDFSWFLSAGWFFLSKTAVPVFFMISGYLPGEGVYAARSEGDAPDIDNYVFVRSEKEWNTGDFVRVKITGASEYDLEGVPEDEFLYEDESAE